MWSDTWQSREKFTQKAPSWLSRPAAFFLKNVLQLHQQRWVILRVDSLALWNIFNEEEAVLIPKIEAKIFPVGFCTRNFWGRGEPLCRHSTDCCFVSGSLWYNQVSSMVTNRDRKLFGSRRKNSKLFSDEWQLWHFLSMFRHFGTHFAESFLMSKSSWMMDLTR